jgi:hypothetical protein
VRRDRRPRCGADGVHRHWWRTVAAYGRVHRPGLVRRQLQLRGQGRREPADRPAPHPALLHRTRYLPSFGSPFTIHGIVDKIDPILESAICIGQNPPPGGNELIFLGRYRPTAPAPAGLEACPRQETSTTPLCRFEVIVRDNDQDLGPSTGEFFSIKLSSSTVLEGELDPATVVYARAGVLERGNLTVN